MSRKNITDIQVLQAYQRCKETHESPYELLARETGEHWKVCYLAMERADSRGLIDVGVSLRSGCVSKKGLALLEEHARINAICRSSEQLRERESHEQEEA